MTEWDGTTSITAAAASPLAPAQGGDACPVCATAGAGRGKRCVSCGVRFICPKCDHRFTFDEVRTKHSCTSCGHPHSVPDERLVTRTMPSVEPLEAALDNLLRDGEAGAGPTLRRGKFDLARAYGVAGNWRQAVELLDAAASEPGDDPAGTELRRWRARALLANGDLVGAARALLDWPFIETWDEVIEGLARALLAAVAADDAARLATWLESSLASDPATTVSTLVRARVLDAALRLLAGDPATALEALAAAAEQDPATARRTWQALADAPLIAAALQPSAGNEAAALTLSARIKFSLGYTDEASELVAEVLDGQLTGEGYPEAEAYLLRGHDAARPASERAKDLLEAAQRLGWRDDRTEMRRSLEVAAKAVELEPTLQDAYWLWAENQRYAAYQPDGSIDKDDMLAALSIWDRGRGLGPSADAWPRRVEALICQELARFNIPTALTLAWRCLRAASESALGDPGAPLSWVSVSQAAYLLRLWSTAGFAADLSAQLARDSPEQLSAALDQVYGVCFQIAPERVPGTLDELEREQGSTPWIAGARAIRDVRAGQHDRAKAELRGQLAKAPAATAYRYWYLRSLVLSGDDAAAAFIKESIRQTEDWSRIGELQVRVWALLWGGRAAEAADLISHLRQGGVERLLDQSETVGLSIQAALLQGDHSEAEELARTLLPSLPLGLLTDLDDEFRWVEQQLEKRGDQAGSVCANRIRAATAQARSSAPYQGPQDLGAVLVELERAICDGTLSLQERRAASTARLLISAYASPKPDVADWLTPLAVELGENLMPADFDNGGQWGLVTDIVLRMKACLEETTGLPLPPIEVRSPDDIGPLQFRVLLDQHQVTEGTVERPDAVPEPQATGIGQVDPASWQHVTDAVSETLSTRPSVLCTPEAVGSFLIEWLDGTQQQQNLAQRLSADRTACIQLWLDMYARTLSTRRVPVWDSGLRQITEEALESTLAVPPGSPSSATAGLTADRSPTDEPFDRSTGQGAEYGGENE